MARRLLGLALGWGLVFAPSALAEPGGQRGGGGKVLICHVPPGNPEAAHSIKVGEAAVRAHLGHGDQKGACDRSTTVTDEQGTPRGQDATGVSRKKRKQRKKRKKRSNKRR